MDFAIFSARIFTGNESRPWADAVHIRGNRIVAVGSAAEVKGSCTRATEKIELPGRLVTPGLIDAHTHFVNFGLYLENPNLRDLPSLAACRERIRRAADSSAAGEWIVGRGWNHHLWDEGKEPGKEDLDDITPHHPVMMVRACGHSAWVNSLALKAAGITRDTPDPPGGKIDRDPTGEPTGILREARYLIEEKIPPHTVARLKRAATLAQKEAVRFGLTGVHSCEKLAHFEALAALDVEGKLAIRVHHLVPGAELEMAASKGFRPGFGTEKLWLGHVKLFADGSLGAGTALLHDPYTDAPEECGIPFLSPEALSENVKRAHRNGWDVAIHAIGDLAVTNALLAIAEGRKAHPGARRDRIEHVQLLRPADLPMFRALGAVASIQPAFLPTDWIPATRRWGESRCLNAYAWKTLAASGIPLQFGSDAPVEPIDPILGLHAAVTRETPQGKPAGGWFPSQKLTLGESLAGYTRTAAWTSRRETALGEIGEGKWADITVFSEDLFRAPPASWLSIPVEMTVVDGEMVYRRE